MEGLKAAEVTHVRGPKESRGTRALAVRAVAGPPGSSTFTGRPRNCHITDWTAHDGTMM
jgi:hypothetical protein